MKTTKLCLLILLTMGNCIVALQSYIVSWANGFTKPTERTGNGTPTFRPVLPDSTITSNQDGGGDGSGASSTARTDELYKLIYYATLAPSSHNTQCWKFRIDRNNDDADSSKSSSTGSITILPDFSRSCPVVDPDYHHLYASLGCAVENLVIAAQAHGYETRVDASSPQDGIQVHLKKSSPVAALATPEVMDLFQAIPKRQVSRCDYNGHALEPSELDSLQKAVAAAGGGGGNGGGGVHVVLVTDRKQMQDIQDQVLLANAAQINDPSFMKELRSWVRFNEKDAVSHGDGLYSKANGNPSIPTFLGNAIFNYIVRPSAENAKIAHQVESSAGFAMFVSQIDDPIHWVQAGRCYERFALQATIMGIRNAMLNQPVEVAKMRPAFVELMGLKKSSRVDLVVRFGKGPEVQGISPRRPLHDVVIMEGKP
jgi:hypothetical protein